VDAPSEQQVMAALWGQQAGLRSGTGGTSRAAESLVAMRRIRLPLETVNGRSCRMAPQLALLLLLSSIWLRKGAAAAQPPLRASLCRRWQ
jgi:hypothetical protein